MDVLLGATLEMLARAVALAAGEVRRVWRAFRDGGVAGVAVPRLVAAVLQIVACIPVLAAAGKLAAVMLTVDDFLLFFTLLIGLPVAFAALFSAVLYCAGAMAGAAGWLTGERVHQAFGVVAALTALVFAIGFVQMDAGAWGWWIVVTNAAVLLAAAAALVTGD